MMEGPDADSEEKHEPASDIDTGVLDSLKALGPKQPIREATRERTSPGSAWSCHNRTCQMQRTVRVVDAESSWTPGRR